MSKDLRGYRYQLDSAHQLAKLKKDKAQMQLAQAVGALNRRKHALQEARQHLNQEVAALGGGAVAEGHTLCVMRQTMRQSQIGFLLGLHQRIELASASLQESEAQVKMDSQALMECQMRLDMFERDRRRSEAGFLLERARQGASEADRDWLARTAAGQPAREEQR